MANNSKITRRHLPALLKAVEAADIAKIRAWEDKHEAGASSVIMMLTNGDMREFQAIDTLGRLFRAGRFECRFQRADLDNRCRR